MRMLMIAALPTDIGNALIRDGSLGPKLQSCLEPMKPESAYFTVNDDGERTAYVVFDLKDSSEIVKMAEPWYMHFQGRLTLRPVMNSQDMAAAAPYLEAAAKIE